MKIINRIKAFFRKNDETVELDLVAAEIRSGKAFLHTKGEESMTYLVRANDVEIWLNKDVSLRDIDIMTIKEKPKKDPNPTQQNKAVTDPNQTAENGSGQDVLYDLDRFKKRKFVISVYPEEYEAINATIKEYGYKRADFVLACVSTATKGTMEKAHKRIVKSHREIVLEQQALVAKQAAETGRVG